MKKLYFTIGIFLCFLISVDLSGQETNRHMKVRIISDNGLRMRDAPSIKGNEVTIIPFLAVAECLEAGELSIHSLKEETYYTDTDKTEISDAQYEYTPQIGGKYGLWRKVKYKEHAGWVFDAWLYYESDPLIENLHYLNDIPHDYFWVSDSYEEGDIIGYDCFGGFPKIHIFPLGDNYRKHPYIALNYGQDSQHLEITGVEKEDGKYILKVKNPPYNEDKGIKEITIEKSGNLYFAEGNGLTFMREKQFLVPIHLYNEKISVECAEEP